MEIVCNYCGVNHPERQSFCNGCGSALPPPGEVRDTTVGTNEAGGRKGLLIAAGVIAVLVTGVLLFGYRDVPQKVEVVNFADAAPVVAASDLTASGADQRRYLITARFSAAYSTVTTLRMMLLNHRMTTGEYPSDFAELGVDESELTDGEYVTGVSLRPGGIMVAQLDSRQFGSGATLTLTPRDVMAGTRTRWDCTTTIPEEDRLSGPGHIPCTVE